MNHFMENVTTIILSIVGLAIISVLVSNKANTTGVIQSAASGLANNIGVAESPVTGTNVSLQLGYPNSYGSAFGT